MRWPAALVLLAFLAAGCLEPNVQECQPLRGHGIVQEVSGRDARVLLDDGQPAVLHLSDDVYVLQGGSGACVKAGPGAVQVGDQITFEVDAWAESYPVQGWPEKAIVVR